MANLIESQLCVTGEKGTIEYFKNTFITFDKDRYIFDFDKLFLEYDYVLSRELIQEDALTENDLKRILVREEFSPNFDLYYWGCTDYYQYNDKKNKQFQVYSTLSDMYEPYKDISIEENCIKLYITSKDNPPIHSIIHLSKSYPNLDFRLAFYDSCNSFLNDCYGCIVGKNGIFDGPQYDFGHYHKVSKRFVFQIDFDYWCYCDNGERVEEKYFSPEITNYIFI